MLCSGYVGNGEVRRGDMLGSEVSGTHAITILWDVT